MREVDALIARRDRAIKSLDKSLEHVDRVRLISILTSFLPLERLEEIADFQDRMN
jgi:hypothetical protein